MTAPPQEDPYRALKERLLISHKLTTVQMAEKVLDLPALGDRRPSQLLAAMLEFCPAGEADTAFFRASFFRRLPKEIRVLLADEVNDNLKELAIRADELYTHHRSTAVAAIHQGDMWEDTASLEEAVPALNLKGGRDNFRPKPEARQQRGSWWRPFFRRWWGRQRRQRRQELLHLQPPLEIWGEGIQV